MQTLAALVQKIKIFNEAIFKKDFHFYWDATYPGSMHTNTHVAETKPKDLLIICHYDGSRLDSIGDYHLAFKECTQHNLPANKSLNDNYEHLAVEIIDTTLNNFSEDKQKCFVEKCSIKLWVGQGYGITGADDFYIIACTGFYFKKLEWFL
jgi:hypothetical protein